MKKPASPLGRKIRTARQRLGEPQWKVAEAAGILQSVLSEIEIGTHRSRPEAAMLVRLAKHLHIDPLVLLRLGRNDYAVWRDAFATKRTEGNS